MAVTADKSVELDLGAMQPDIDDKVDSPTDHQQTFSTDGVARTNKINLITRSATMSGGLLDKKTFTFKPKMSNASMKIAEALGTDFMARQQQHIEKQRKHIERAGLQYRSQVFGRLSPVNRSKKSKTKSGKEQSSDTEEGKSSKLTEEGSDDKSQDEVASDKPSSPAGELAKADASLSALIAGASELIPTSRKKSPSYKPSHSRVSRHQRSVPSETQHSLLTTDDKASVEPVHISQGRSKTMPAQVGGRPGISRKLTTLNVDRMKNAKEMAERAMKHRKIFVIQGPYPKVRESLRKRGWVEKFYKMSSLHKKSPRRKRKHTGEEANTDDDDSDDDDDDDDVNDDDMGYNDCSVPPWDEDNGIYGIMSRIVRNVSPTFIWSVRRDVVDFRYLKKDQIVNHYAKAGSFTTKVGLCTYMRNVPWFDQADPDSFFPRCYRLSHDEEKQSFIDDYRLTTCTNILKHMREKHNAATLQEGETGQEEGDKVCTNPECTKSRPNSSEGNRCVHAEAKPAPAQSSPDTAATSSTDSQNTGKLRTLPPIEESSDSEAESSDCDAAPIPLNKRNQPASRKKGGVVPQTALEWSIKHCRQHLRFKRHDDIDLIADEDHLSEADWEQLIQWYYKLVHDGATMNVNMSEFLEDVDDVLNQMKAACPQFELDGTRNVWIVKPGAKSRGRGIMCYDRLEDMLRLVSSSVFKKEGKYVVQKYIERPLLVYNTKFDIRQWFLVTDWNPLTLYFYKESYLRFCSQQYTLDDFNEAIHLSNNAIQKNYTNGPRSDRLPLDNMWSSEEFKQYLRERGFGTLWDDLIYPGMRKAVLCALLSAQDVIEYRKSAFELYGADFMLTEDYQPWLIEINCSPSMSYSTKVTSKLCSMVLDDTVKVVLDRRTDKNCDIGEFELAYKQPYVNVPPYIGIDLTVSGQTIKKPHGHSLRRSSECPHPQLPKSDAEIVYRKQQMAQQSVVEKATSAPAKMTGANVGPPIPAIRTSTGNPTTVAKGQRHYHSPRQQTMQVPRMWQSSVEPTRGQEVSTERQALKRETTQRKLISKPDGFTALEKPQSLSELRAVPSDSRLIPDTHIPLERNGRLERPLFPLENVESTDLSMVHELPQTTPRGKSLPVSEVTFPPSFQYTMEYLLPSHKVKRDGKKKRKKGTNKGPKSRSMEGVGHVQFPAIPEEYFKEIILGRSGIVHRSMLDSLLLSSDCHPCPTVATLTEGTWAKTCTHCGNGMNLKLDSANTQPCQCQQDSIMLDYGGQRSRSVGASTQGSRPVTPVSRSRTPVAQSGSAPSICKMNVDRNKLVSTVYSKTYGQDPNKGRYVLRYTDGGIQRPKSPKNILQKSFPQLVSRYVAKKPEKDDILMSIDSYRTTGRKLSVVSHTFHC